MKNKKIYGFGVIYILLLILLITVCDFDISDLTTATTLSQPSDNGAYYSNLDSSYMNTNSADPSLIKGPDGCFYAFATMKYAYRSCDSKTWTRWTYSFDKTLPSHSWFWAPEVYKINNYYYMFFTLAKKGAEGNAYLDSDAMYSIFYARSKDLKTFEYLGEMPYGASYFSGRISHNPAHIDGSLLIDNGKYYFYFPMLNRDHVLDYDGYELYGIEVKLNSNGTFSEAGTPKVIMRRNSESNPIESNDFTWFSRQGGNFYADYENLDEGPYVVKKNGKYYLTYSVGNYTNDSYHVIVATSNSPLGPYVRDKMPYANTSNENQPKIRFLINGYNYPSTLTTDSDRDSSRNIYGTGHGSILTLTNYDTIIGYYNEYYYAYHSNIYNSNKEFAGRKLTIDGMNFSGSTMFVNGPTTVMQPLISGSTYNGSTYYKIPSSKYSINSGVLSDGLKYNAMNISSSKVDINTLNISFKNNERVNLSDIWIYGNGSNFSSVLGTLYINEGTDSVYQMAFNAKVNGSVAKIQIPSIGEKVKNIRIVFKNTLSLSEVELVRTSQDNYYMVTFDSAGGSNISKVMAVYNSSSSKKVQVPTKSGYKFTGWYTKEGTQVYDASGNFKSGTNYINTNGAWVYKNDVTLVAHWEKPSSVSPTSTPVSTPTPTPKVTSTPVPTTPVIPTFPIVIPTATPTQTPVATPVPTSTPVPTPTDKQSIEPTVKPTSTPTPSATAKPKPIETPTPIPTDYVDDDEVIEPKRVGLIEYLFSSPLTIGVTIAVALFLAAGAYTVIDYKFKK